MYKILTKLGISAASLALVMGVAMPMVASASTNSDNENDKPQVYACHLKEVKTENDDSEHRTLSSSVVRTFEVVKADKDGDVDAPDFLYAGPLTKSGNPDRELGPIWCQNHQPGDMCANIDGKQSEVPAGKVVNSDHQCVDKPVVTPTPTPTPQVLGAQTTVTPTGGVKAGGGGAGNSAAAIFGMVGSIGTIAAGLFIRKFAL